MVTRGLCCENKENSEHQDHQGCERQKYNQPSFHLRIHVTRSIHDAICCLNLLNVIFGECDGFPGTKQTYNIMSYRLTPDTPVAKGGDWRNILVKWPISSPRCDQWLIMGLDKYYAFAVAITCYNYIWLDGIITYTYNCGPPNIIIVINGLDFDVDFQRPSFPTSTSEPRFPAKLLCEQGKNEVTWVNKDAECAWMNRWWHSYIFLPSGKQPQNYGKSPFSMGKSTINVHVQ